MKKSNSQIILLILIISAVLNSCKKEEQDPNVLLSGKWNQTSLTTVNFYDNVKQNETTRTYDTGEIVLEIYSDGTAEKFVAGRSSDAYYWRVEGDLLILTTGTSGMVQNIGFSVNETDLNMQWAVQESLDGHIIRSEYITTYKRD